MSSFNQNSPDLGLRWWIALQNAPELRRHIPLEVSTSYPVVGQNELSFFHFRVVDKIIHRPFTLIRACLPDLKITQFQISSEHEPLYAGLPDELGNATRSRDIDLEAATLNLLPQIVQRFPHHPAGALGKQYLEAFVTLVEPTLMPFYSVLQPDFFVWLQR